MIKPPAYEALQSSLATCFYAGHLTHHELHFLNQLIIATFRPNDEAAEAADSFLSDMMSQYYSGASPSDDDEAEMAEAADRHLSEGGQMHQDETPPDFPAYITPSTHDTSGLPVAVACGTSNSSSPTSPSVRRTPDRRRLRRIPNQGSEGADSVSPDRQHNGPAEGHPDIVATPRRRGILR